jgi:hypothetical protein
MQKQKSATAVLIVIMSSVMSVKSMEISGQLAATPTYTIAHLYTLPDELLPAIFHWCRQDLSFRPRFSRSKSLRTFDRSIKKCISTFMQLRLVCKKFEMALTSQKIGYLCKNYISESEKLYLDHVLKNVIKKFFSDANRQYYALRVSLLLLLRMGASPNQESMQYVLQEAIAADDEEVTRVLLNYPKSELSYTAILYNTNFFYYVKTIKIAQILIDHRFSIQRGIEEGLLHRIIIDRSYELIEFYINERNVDISVDAYKANESLLHLLVSHYWDVDFFKKVALLLSKQPDMINSFDKRGQTPLDCIQKSLIKLRSSLKKEKQYFSKNKQVDKQTAKNYEKAQEVEQFLKTQGGLTAQKLKKEEEHNKKQKK